MLSIRLFLQKRFRFLALLSALAILIGQMPFWFFELFSHFLPHYAGVFLLAALLDKGKWRYLWLLASAFSALWLCQGLFHHPQPTQTQRLLWYNVHLHNPNIEAEIAHIRAQSADILAFAELNPHANWQILRAQYPYGCEFEQESPFALALWAKQALISCQIKMAADYPYLVAQTDALQIVVLHPPPPITAELAQARQTYLHIVAAEMAQSKPLLAVGDLNSSPFSPIFRRLLAEGKVRAQSPYYLPTWKPLFINIDHVLTRGISAKTKALSWTYSDHRALLIQW